MEEARRTAKGWNDPPSMEEMVKNSSSTSHTNHISTIKKYRSYRSDVSNPAPAGVSYALEQPGSNVHLGSNVYLGAPNATSAATRNYQS